MKIRQTKGLTFDDVLLVPKRSPIASRQDVNTGTSLTNTIALNIPIVSANMDTVTEAEMAIAMARHGGMGILHRFMTIERQVAQVRRVKRAEGFLVENPQTVRHEATIDEARRLMTHLDVGGLVVANSSGAFIGLITQRDILLTVDDTAPISSVMTKLDDIVYAKPGTTLVEAQAILHEHRLEKLPVLNEAGELVGLITAQDIVKQQRYPFASKDSLGRLQVGAAIGIKTDDMERSRALLEAGADLLVLDIAHGHADHCIEMITHLRHEFPQAQIMAGNVASRDGARELAEAGADAIKVGVGPGSICTTRIVTGFGVPQLTAIMDSAAGVQDTGRQIPLIADGGIKSAGDMVKALAAGADAVMIGSLFAGCEESPGAAVIRNGQKFKVVRGMASLSATMDRQQATAGSDESAESQADWDKVVAEGVEAVVPYRGHVHEILHQMVGGLRSGLSYGGARTICELQEKAEFIEISGAGVRESQPHDVTKM